MKCTAAALAVLGLSVGLVPGAYADTEPPVIEGSIATSGPGLLSACSITCQDFFVADCPETLAQADGVHRSIVDVSDLAGETLDFHWSASSTDVYTSLEESGNSNESGSQVFFYLVDSCTAPTGPSFALTTRPAELTKTVELSDDAAWLIVETDTAQDLSWWATAVDEHN